MYWEDVLYEGGIALLVIGLVFISAAIVLTTIARWILDHPKRVMMREISTLASLAIVEQLTIAPIESDTLKGFRLPRKYRRILKRSLSTAADTLPIP